MSSNWIDKKMLPAKLCMFFSSATKISLLINLPLYLSSIGLEAHQIGIVLSCSKVGFILSTIFWGTLADSSNKYRQIVCSLSLLSALFIYFKVYAVQNMGYVFGYQCDNGMVVCEENTVSISKQQLLYIMASLCFTETLFSGSLNSLLTTGIVRIIQNSSYKIEFGKQIVFGNIGVITMSVVSTYVVNLYTNPIAGYSILLYVIIFFRVLFCINANMMFRGFTSTTTKQTKVSIKIELINFISQADSIVFLLTSFMFGILFNAYGNNLLMFLNDLGASQNIIAWSMSLAPISGMLTSIFSSKMIRKLDGTFNTLLFSLSVGALRLFIMSMITDPIYILPLQLFLHGLHIVLFVVASAEHLRIVVPKTIQATVSGISMCIGEGVAASVGSIVGGYLRRYYDIRSVFALCASVSAIWCVFLLGYLLYIRGKHQDKEIKIE